MTEATDSTDVERLKAALLELADAAAEQDYHDGTQAAECRVCAAVRVADELLGAAARQGGVRLVPPTVVVERLVREREALEERAERISRTLELGGYD
jgi:hypothetical protein